MKEINLVKRHIKNLINGHSLSKSELFDMYKDIVRETIANRVERMFKARSIDDAIDAYVKIAVRDHINNLLVKENFATLSGTGAYNRDIPRIERLIRDECDKQVRDIIRDQVKITITSPN